MAPWESGESTKRDSYCFTHGLLFSRRSMNFLPLDPASNQPSGSHALTRSKGSHYRFLLVTLKDPCTFSRHWRPGASKKTAFSVCRISKIRFTGSVSSKSYSLFKKTWFSQSAMTRPWNGLKRPNGKKRPIMSFKIPTRLSLLASHGTISNKNCMLPTKKATFMW